MGIWYKYIQAVVVVAVLEQRSVLPEVLRVGFRNHGDRRHWVIFGHDGASHWSHH